MGSRDYVKYFFLEEILLENTIYSPRNYYLRFKEWTHKISWKTEQQYLWECKDGLVSKHWQKIYMIPERERDGVQWIMPSFVACLLFCWRNWLGKYKSDIWNLVLGCLIRIVWLERNHRLFKDTEKSLDHLKDLYQQTLFDWYRCWGSSKCSSSIELIASLSIALWFFVLLFSLLFALLCSSSWILCSLFFYDQ